MKANSIEKQFYYKLIKDLARIESPAELIKWGFINDFFLNLFIRQSDKSTDQTDLKQALHNKSLRKIQCKR